MLKKKSKKIEVQEIEEFLNKHNIYAILMLPNFGVFSCFQSEGDKLEILEQAKMEKKIRDKLTNTEIENRIQDDINYFRNKNNHTPNYIK